MNSSGPNIGPCCTPMGISVYSLSLSFYITFVAFYSNSCVVNHKLYLLCPFYTVFINTPFFIFNFFIIFSTSPWLANFKNILLLFICSNSIWVSLGTDICALSGCYSDSEASDNMPEDILEVTKIVNHCQLHRNIYSYYYKYY